MDLGKLLFTTDGLGVWSHAGFDNLSCLTKGAARRSRTLQASAFENFWGNEWISTTTCDGKEGDMAAHIACLLEEYECLLMVMNSILMARGRGCVAGPRRRKLVELGADRFSDIIEDMTGHRPSVFFKLCWKFIIPVLSLISFILYLVDYKHLMIGDYVYPDWAYALGWFMTLSSVLMVPLWAAGQMCLTAGTFRQRLSILCHPAEDPAWQTRKMGEEDTTVELTTSAVTT